MSEPNSFRNNVDDEEIAKFSALASQWWDKQGKFKPLHDINPLRVNYIDERAKLAGKTVLDIGCGGGILTEAMAFRGAQVTGIDMGEAPLNVARLHAMEKGIDIDYQHTTAEQLAEEKPASFDTVTCLEMLEHVPDPAAIVKACATLVKPGGQLFFATINRNFKSWLLAIIGAEYLLRLLPVGTHDYDKLIRPAELSQWIRDTGLLPRDIIGMTYNPLTRTYKLNRRDVDVNYLLFASRPQL